MTELRNRPDEGGTLRLIHRLQTIFQDGNLYNVVLDCQGDVAQSLLDGFQWLLDRPECESNSDFRRHLVVVTQRLAKRSNLYPTCYELKGITLENQLPVGAGGFADIYKGSFEGRPVCLKAIRTYQSSQNKSLLKQITHESILWGQLDHENVQPFYGLYYFNNRVCFVSPWMEAGDVQTYLEKHPKANRGQLVVGVAKGLQYLHENGIVHGDLKGPNILINEEGRACLTDFGISAMSVPQIIGWVSTSSVASKGGSVRWQGPELFDITNDTVVKNTKESDVYAWSCVCYEIYTSTVPFANIRRDSTVELQIMQGARPERPSDDSLSWCEWGLTLPIWTLMEECWLADPSNRPTLPQIIDRLGAILTPGDISDQGIPKLSPNRFRQRLKDTMNLTSLFVNLGYILSHMEKDHRPPTQINIPSQQGLDICKSEHIPDAREKKRPRLESKTKPSKSNAKIVHQAPLQSLCPDLPRPKVPELKKEGDDWIVFFNPQLRQSLDISLVHTLTHTHGKDVYCVRFSPDGRYLATGGNHTVQVYDVATGDTLCILSDELSHNGWNRFLCVCFSMDGKLLAAGADDKAIRIWDYTTNRIDRVFDCCFRVDSIDFSHDGRFMVSNSGPVVTIWNLHDKSHRVLSDFGVPNKRGHSTTSIAISPNGQLVALASRDSTVRIWDIEMDALQELKGYVDSVRSVAFMPDGRGLVSGTDTTLKYWDISVLSNKNTLPEFVPRWLRDLKDHKDTVLSVSVSHDGRWVVSGSKDMGVRFWDINNGTLQLVLQGHKHYGPSSVISIDINPDGNMLATASGEGTVKIWRYKTVQ